MKIIYFLSLFLSVFCFAGEKQYPFCPLVIAEPQPSTGWFSSGRVSQEDSELAKKQNEFLARINDPDSNNLARFEYASWLKAWNHPYAKFLELETNFDDETRMDSRAYALLVENKKFWYAPLVPEYVSDIEMGVGVIHSVTVEIKSILRPDEKFPEKSKLERLFELVPTLRRIDFLVGLQDQWIFKSFEGAHLTYFAPQVSDSAVALQLNETRGRVLILTSGILSSGHYLNQVGKGRSSWNENPFIVYLKNIARLSRELNRNN